MKKWIRNQIKTQKTDPKVDNANNPIKKKNTRLFLKRFFFYAAAILMAIGFVHALIECIIIDQNPANSAPGWVAFLLYLPIYTIVALICLGIGFLLKGLEKRKKQVDKKKDGNIQMTYGEKIYTLREKNGLSQEELAEKLDVSRQTISNWENDKVKIDIIKAKQLCDIFQIGIEEFCAEELPQENTEKSIGVKDLSNEKNLETKDNAPIKNAETTNNNKKFKKWDIVAWIVFGLSLICVLIAVVDTFRTGTLTVGSVIQLKSSWWMTAIIGFVVCTLLRYLYKKNK